MTHIDTSFFSIESSRPGTAFSQRMNGSTHAPGFGTVHLAVQTFLASQANSSEDLTPVPPKLLNIGAKCAQCGVGTCPSTCEAPCSSKDLFYLKRNNYSITIPSRQVVKSAKYLHLITCEPFERKLQETYKGKRRGSSTRLHTATLLSSFQIRRADIIFER